MANVINSQILLRGDSEENWLAEDHVLAEREPSVIIGGPNHGRMKIGDGVTRWSDLPFSGGGALNRRVWGDTDPATFPVTDTGGDLGVPIMMQVAPPESNPTLPGPGTWQLRRLAQRVLDNLANLFNRAGVTESQIESLSNLGRHAGTFDTRAELPTTIEGFSITCSPGDMITHPPGDFITLPPGDLITRPPGDFITRPPDDMIAHSSDHMITRPPGSFITVNDFVNVREDETQGDATTRYIISEINSGLITYTFDIAYNTDISGKADNTGSITVGSGTATNTPAQANTTVWGMLQNIWNRIFALNNSKQNNLNRTIEGDDASTIPVNDGGGNLRIPISVTTTVPVSNDTQTAPGTRSLRVQIQTFVNNIANLFQRINVIEGKRFVPSGGLPGQFLRQDMTWAAPIGGIIPTPTPTTWFVSMEFPQIIGTFIDPVIFNFINQDSTRVGDFAISMHSASQGIVARLELFRASTIFVVVGTIGSQLRPSLDDCSLATIEGYGTGIVHFPFIQSWSVFFEIQMPFSKNFKDYYQNLFMNPLEFLHWFTHGQNRSVLTFPVRGSLFSFMSETHIISMNVIHDSRIGLQLQVINQFGEIHDIQMFDLWWGE